MEILLRSLIDYLCTDHEQKEHDGQTTMKYDTRPKGIISSKQIIKYQRVDYVEVVEAYCQHGDTYIKLSLDASELNVKYTAPNKPYKSNTVTIKTQDLVKSVETVGNVIYCFTIYR